ncbi:MAG: SDR family oxidoreductase [Smithella sp.]|jgi:NAD(P)-dependent dehydrogenase (short-subunit alcohol dehydrogenase family)
MEKISFEGKVVIVTGSGSGLGREYALEFARRGASVVVNDLGVALDGSGSTHSAADAVVNEITNFGGKAVANYDSVATPEGGSNIVKTAVDKFGTVDVLVNNAGFVRDKSFNKMTIEEWDAVMSVHLRGAFCVTQPALAVMREHNYGRIIMTSSTSGSFGNFGQSNYGAAKMGLVGLMNVLKLETSKFSVHINAIAPTAYSRMTANLIPQELAPKLQAKFNVPMVVYLCSEECPENGSIFTMGAGWYAKTAIVCATGACLGDGSRDIPAEEVRENFAKIADLTGAKPLHDSLVIFDFMGPLLQ